MSQKIKRADLVELYNKFTCSTWKERITPYLIENTSSEISLKKEDVVYASKNADAKQLKALKEVGVNFDEVQSLSNLKSYENACSILKRIPEIGATAGKQLLTIIAAANFLENDEKEWTPDFNNSNIYKYLPYFIRKDAGWVFGSVGGWYSYSFCPVGFYFKNSDTAKTIAERFFPLYLKWLQDGI